MTSNFDRVSFLTAQHRLIAFGTGLLCSGVVLTCDSVALAQEINSNTAASAVPSKVEATKANAAEANPLELQEDPSSSQDTLSTAPQSIELAKDLNLSEDELTRLSLLMQSDHLYEQGLKSEAASVSRQAKSSDHTFSEGQSLSEPSFDESLSGAAKVYWREGNDGLEKGLESKIIVPLTLLTETHPEFIPGHLKLAEGHRQFNRPEEALSVLERAASLYPSVPELQEALMKQQVSLYRWLPAAITARQFATLNPNHPKATEFAQLAEEYQRKFRATVREDLTSNAIGSVLTGALNVGLMGNPLGALSPIQNAIALLRGEESVGESATKSYLKKLPIVEDPEVNAYVTEIGQKLAAVSGRDLKYEFYVINDDRVNAFALPGGKIFIHSGAILKCKSEAELAGLIAHELSHAVLSHGFQMYTESNATGSFTQIVPFSGLFSRVAVTKYSREMETQADLLGTRILANAGYAADGLENLMQTLMADNAPKADNPWMSNHSDPEERITYLASLIERNGYNRYAYEGVTPHLKILQLATAELDTLQQSENLTPNEPDSPDAMTDISAQP